MRDPTENYVKTKFVKWLIFGVAFTIILFPIAVIFAILTTLEDNFLSD